MRKSLTNSEVLAAAAALSVPRLSSYKRFFGVITDADAYGMHRWNEALSGLLFKCVSLTEIVMRNRIHEVFSTYYGTVGWAGSRDWYSHLQLSGISQDSIRGVTHNKNRHTGVWTPKTPAPSPDDVISSQTFGFWANLFEVSQDIGGSSISWPVLFPKIFQGHRQTSPSFWGQGQRDVVLARIKTCNAVRNRIAHHEPLWKWGVLMEEKMHRRGAASPVAVAPAPATPQEAMDRLTLMHDRVVELFGWLSPALKSAYLNTEAYAQFKSVNSRSGLTYYQMHGCSREINLSKFRLLSKLKKELRTSSRRKGVVLIK